MVKEFLHSIIYSKFILFFIKEFTIMLMVTSMMVKVFNYLFFF